MKLLSIQEAYTRKFKRQEAIKELQYHASGHCVHIGKISPGCGSCFVYDRYHRNLLTGAKCNLNCCYCFYKMKEPGKIDLLNTITSIIRESREPHYRPTSISFSGGGEPLLYMKTIREYMKVYNDIKKETKGSPWFYLYTNGVLATKDILEELRDLGIDEIRFHLGASNFSKDVYKNVSLARKYFKALTVETPAWPPHKTKLFEMLPIIEDIGVDHVNIGEIEVTQYNRRKIAKILPDAEIYQCHEMHLYDNGLVYDIMEEALRRKYSYSVLDCNCFVKSIQRGPAKMIQHENLRGLFAGY